MEAWNKVNNKDFQPEEEPEERPSFKERALNKINP
jgi:hypothetical protein